MSGKINDESNVSSILSTSDFPHNDSFIDDYSHLRLSYYQVRGNFEDTLSSGFDETHYDPNLTHSDVNTTCDTEQTNVSSTFEDLERKKLREYYLSQMPDVPHPSCTVASIISAVSSRMNSGDSCFKYESQIEQGANNNNRQDLEYKFSPNRRSTLKPHARK